MSVEVGERLARKLALHCGVHCVHGRYDASGNITQYTRPNNPSIPGADGALITLSGYTAFNLPTTISKTGTVSGTGTVTKLLLKDNICAARRCDRQREKSLQINNLFDG